MFSDYFRWMDMRWVVLAVMGLAVARGVLMKRPHVEAEVRKSSLEFVDSALIAVLLVFFVIRPFIMQAFYIPSGSMRPTLQVNDRILVNKFLYFIREPKRGDVIVFLAPPKASPEPKEFIKRLMGKPGDLIAVVEGQLYRIPKERLNDEDYDPRVDEPYIREPMWTEFPPPFFASSADEQKFHKLFGDTVTVRGIEYVRVPEGALFAMGDNRNDSNDSRRWGFMPRPNLRGKAMAIFWPLRRIRMVH